MTKLLGSGARILLVAVVCTISPSLCQGNDQSTGACEDYPIALYPDPDAQAQAEADLQGFAPGGSIVWHPARGTFWFVNLSVPLPQCGAQDNVYTHLFALTAAHPDLFQLDLAEWDTPPSVPCATIGQVPQLLEIERARVGSHPIAHDSMKFTVQRVNGTVALIALQAEYLPPATPSLDADLSACPNLDEELAEQAVMNSHYAYSIYRYCYYVGAGVYSPNALDSIAFNPVARWAWNEDPLTPRVLFTKSNEGRLLLNRANHTGELIQSDANCPGENGQPKIGFRLTLDSVENDLVSSTPGLNCVVCLR
jgi:hypothetical protein